MRVANPPRMRNKTTVMIALASASLAFLAVVLASGCTWLGLVCTQIGCDDEVSVSIRGLETDQFYDVELDTGTQTIHCTIDTSQSSYMRIQCVDDLYSYSQRDEASIHIAGTPDSVAITILKNGTVIAEDVVRPEYDEVAPNGRACGPICVQARIPIEL
jgi:hypothetical protein